MRSEAYGHGDDHGSRKSHVLTYSPHCIASHHTLQAALQGATCCISRCRAAYGALLYCCTHTDIVKSEARQKSYQGGVYAVAARVQAWGREAVMLLLLPTVPERASDKMVHYGGCTTDLLLITATPPSTQPPANFACPQLTHHDPNTSTEYSVTLPY